MAHLPLHVQDRILPLLIDISKKYWSNVGSMFRVFNCLREHNREGYSNDGDHYRERMDILDGYQFWFVTNGVNGKFYADLEERIAGFNNIHKDIQLDVRIVKAHIDMIICRNASDHYDANYCLVTATQTNQDPFEYTFLPSQTHRRIRRCRIVVFWDSMDLKMKANSECKYICDDHNICLSDEYYVEWNKRFAYRWDVNF